MPEIVPVEYRNVAAAASPESTLPELHHPVSQMSRRFVVGDRFHTSAKPHKSPLCEYHNINNCAQAFTLKTSYQGSENNRKNKKRLRSSCMQSFHIHFYYNYLMDFYQNEKVVEEQKQKLEATSCRSVSRDRYMKFVV